jgi:type VI secretion system secreted protein Hcp
MDIMLLQPGDPSFFDHLSPPVQDGGPVDNSWRNQVPGLGRCIELVSIHQGMKQQKTTDISPSSRTSGRPIITEFTCVKYVDASSVKLMDYCLRAMPLGTGKHQPTLIYLLRNSGDTASEILTFSLRDALISEVQFQSHPDDMPTEQFKLNFTEILWTSTLSQTKNTAGAVTAAGWSLARNCPITEFGPDHS